MGTHTNDHELKIGSTTRGLKLIKDDKGVALYNVLEDIPRYQNPMEFVQDNWLGGHGQHTFEQPDMYFEGQSIDTTQDGRVILGANINRAIGERKALVDGAVADDGTVTTDETSEAQESTANDMTLLPATPAVNDAYYFGSDEEFNKLWLNVGTAGAGTWTITWEYYNGSWIALTSVVDATTGFTVVGLKTVSFSGPGDWATTDVSGVTGKYWIRGRVSAYTSITTQPKGTQAWVEEPAKDELDANPVDIVWFNTTSTPFVATATKVYEVLITGNLGFWERKDFTGKTITKLHVHDGVLYVAIGSSNKWYYSTDGYVFTQTDLANTEANGFLTAPNQAGTASVLWSFKQPNEVYYTTNGKTAGAGGVALSTAAYVGDTSANITNLFLVNDNLMVGRADGLFHYDQDGGIHPLMPELRKNQSTLNFKYITEFQGAVYFSLVDGLGEISGYNTFELVGPLEGVGNIGKSGSMVGLTSDSEFLFVAIDEGTNTHLYKGKEITRGGGLRWEWCPWAFFSTVTCALIRTIQHSTTNRRVYVGYDNDIGYVSLGKNPTAFGLVYPQTGWIRMSYSYGTNPYWDKLFQSVVTETFNCTANRHVTPKYRKDTDTTATSLTAAIVTNGVVETSVTSTFAALSCKRIQFELHLLTDSSASTPEVSFFKVKGIEKPTTVRIHEAVYAIGSEPSKLASTIRTFLRGGRTSTSLIRFADLRWGETTGGTAGTDFVYCIMEPGYPQELEIKHTRSDEPELAIKVRLREVNYS